MNKKRKPIRKRIQIMVLMISVISLLLISSIGVFSMLKIRKDSENALITQMEQNLSNIVNSKSSLATADLNKYSSFVNQFAAYIHTLYENPSNYAPKAIVPPDEKNAHSYSMQRYLANEDILLEDVIGEISLLGNLQEIWDPVIRSNSDMITTLYLGTKSGFLLSYDNRADLGIQQGSFESHYNFFNSSWYLTGKSSDEVAFTDIYQDAHGRGFMISCVSPFYDKNDLFAGVVCMDILIDDLHKEILDVDLGDKAYAFLVDKSGYVIASPDMTSDNTVHKSIYEISNATYEITDDIMSGNTAISLTTEGIYFAYTPIETVDWKFCVRVPESVIIAPALAMNQDIINAIIIFIVSFVVTITVVTFLVRSFSKQLTDPLIALEKDVKTISAGNLDYQAKIENNDEIGDLAISFNNMAKSLKQYINDLTSVTAEKERIGAELDVAKHIQASMLPCIFPAFPERKEIDIYASMTPAKEVGGDFYDFFMVDDRHLAIVMADVSGKGVPAALFMVIGKTLIKDHTQPNRDLGEVFSEVNNILCESNSGGLFITAFEGVLDLVTGEFCFVNAGHEMPFISKAGSPFEAYKIRPGFVLAGMEGMRYKAGVMELAPGDKLFQYTDGVTEATNKDNELYGMNRLEKILGMVCTKSANEILDSVKEDIDVFVGEAPQFDDITMLCLEYKSRMTITEGE